MTPSRDGTNDAIYARHQHGKLFNQGASGHFQACGERPDGITVRFIHHRGRTAVRVGEATGCKTAPYGREGISTARRRAVPWDSATAECYGAVRAELERQGKLLGPLDLLIATHALGAGAVLVTNDQAFFQVAGLRVEDWVDSK